MNEFKLTPRIEDYSAAGRCINIDWLECYCTEDVRQSPQNSDYFRELGWQVVEREYGTRQYKEMFVLLDNDGRPFIEIRRNPVSSESDSRIKGIFSPFSCHIRLSNRYCYHNTAVDLFSEFCNRYGIIINRIFRLDLCMDFVRFDSGDDPAKFVQRYMKHVYSKINQCELDIHARDAWTERVWQSLKWGSQQSMVSTKLYNKTVELHQRKDKPYIKYAWFASGLTDSPYDSSVLKDGVLTPVDVWRLEFSIKSSARAWYRCEDFNGNKMRVVMKPHTLAEYNDRGKLVKAFADLAHHYFHFKYYVEGKRKDLCKDKELFNWGRDHQPYKLDVLLTDYDKKDPDEKLIAELNSYRMRSIDASVRDACTTIIESLEKRKAISRTANQSKKDGLLLQQLLAKRIKENPKRDFKEDFDEELERIADYLGY